MPSVVIAMSLQGPSPGASRHTTDDTDAHVAVKQLVGDTRADGVVSSEPKLTPDTVTLYPAVATALNSATKLTDGAGNICRVGQSLSVGTSNRAYDGN